MSKEYSYVLRVFAALPDKSLLSVEQFRRGIEHWLAVVTDEQLLNAIEEIPDGPGEVVSLIARLEE